MKKVYLLGAFAALTVGMTLSSCNKENFSEQPTEAEAVTIAEDVLGVTIDPNQDWNMTQNVTANVVVNLGLDQSYTVLVYDKNPLNINDVVYYGRSTVKDGESAIMQLTVPKSASQLFVAVFDSKNRRVVKLAAISEGLLTAEFGTSTRGATRATEAEWTGTDPEYAKTAQDYLRDLTVADMRKFEKITDDDINDQGHIFGNSWAPKMWFKGKSSNRAGVKVWGGGDFTIQEGYNPADGEVAYIYNGNEKVAKITFGGTGGAAVASPMNGYNAKLERPYFIFKSLVEASGDYWQLRVRHDPNFSRVHILDMTTNTEKADFQYDNFDGYLGSVNAGHIYKVYAENNSSIALYNISFYVQGVTIDDDNSGSGGSGSDDSGDSGNTGDSDDSGSGSGDSGSTESAKGTDKMYFVENGTEITKTFKINSKNPEEYDTSVMYIEGKVHLNSDCTLNGPTLVVGAGGELILDGDANMSKAGRFVVLAGGKITTKNNGAYKFNVNNGSPCYNAGTIEMPTGELNVNGSDFYNCGTINVGCLRNTTSTGKLTNFGRITCNVNTDAADAYNCEFINGCYLHFTGNAGVGELKMLNNSRLNITGKLLVPGDVKMYNASEIKCGDIQFQQSKFSAPTADGEFAVLKIDNDIYCGWGGDFEATGNLYADWGNMDNGLYVNGTWSTEFNEWSVYGIIYGKMQLISEDTAPVGIPSSDCAGVGYNVRLFKTTGGSSTTSVVADDEPLKIPGEPNVFTYAFEDTRNGDYDMNDVVIKVRELDDDKIELKLVALGAMYDLQLRLYNYDPSNVGGNYYGKSYEPLTCNGYEELHDMLGAERGAMVNTDADANANPKEIIIDKNGNDYTKLRLALYVPAQYGNAEYEMRLSGAGEAPYGVIIPTDWQWPKERVNVMTAYPNLQQFIEGNATIDWYSNPYSTDSVVQQDN